MHIDYTHAISLGYNKPEEGYYLLIVVDGVDFIWAPSSVTKLDAFVQESQIKIGTICIDLDAAMSSSESFKICCAASNITMQVTAGLQPHYACTSGGNNQGHERTCPLHDGDSKYAFSVLFWPWAVIQFCRIYNYWQCKGKTSFWMMLEGHLFSTALHCDLQVHPFGCFVAGKQPRKDLEVRDTTNSGRGLEGAFLGWELQTLTVWIWSFRKRKPIRLHLEFLPSLFQQ
eukprot:3480831-Rhodomonas_salina.3